MKGNTKKGSVWGGTKAAVWGLCALALVFGFALVGCDDGGGGGGGGPKRLISGKISSERSSSIHGLSASLDISRAWDLPPKAANESFVLDTDPNAKVPAGMTALKGKFQYENVVIVLTGVLDNNSGEFVAAGVDSDNLGIGLQIEGVFKNDTLSNVKLTVKVKRENGEWDEGQFKYQGGANISATTVADQEEGLPAAWTGKYVALSDAEYWKTMINTYLGFQYSPGSPPTGTGGVTVGEAIGDIFAEDGNVFVLVAPMAWSYVIDFGVMDSKLEVRLAEKHFDNVSGIMEKLHAAMAVYEKTFYCSFLEVEQGGTDENGPYYYALAFNMRINSTGQECGGLYTMYKVNKFDNAGTEQLILNNAQNLSISDPPFSGVTFDVNAARAAKSVSNNFTGGYPWTFNTK
jgi:hypothetical protein